MYHHVWYDVVYCVCNVKRYPARMSKYGVLLNKRTVLSVHSQRRGDEHGGRATQYAQQARQFWTAMGVDSCITPTQHTQLHQLYVVDSHT
jgi:hypothetical protein